MFNERIVLIGGNQSIGGISDSNQIAVFAVGVGNVPARAVLHCCDESSFFVADKGDITARAGVGKTDNPPICVIGT